MRLALSGLKALTLVMAATLTACGGDGGAGPSGSSHEDLAGSYAGVMGGTSDGITLDAGFSITLNQDDGALSGSYALSGTLTDGIDVVDVAGTGTLTGTVASGGNPSVTLVAHPALCPSYNAEFTGTYDSNNERLTLTGPVEFFDETCTVFLSYPMVVLLYR